MDKELVSDWKDLMNDLWEVGQLISRIFSKTSSLVPRTFIDLFKLSALQTKFSQEAPRFLATENPSSKKEANKQIPRTHSRELLSSIVSDHDFSKKEKWGFHHQNEEDIVIVPSLSLDSHELSKIPAVNFYEERQLCTLFYLRNPQVRLVFLTSLPVDKSIVDYYLSILQDTASVPNPAKRLLMLNCNDNSLTPLTAKVLRRPRLIQKVASFINPNKAHLTCFISSNLERELAIQLRVPLFSNDPSLSYWGTKSGSREVFKIAGVKFPPGTRLAYTSKELSTKIAQLYAQKHFRVNKFVVKLNLGFSGEGNAILDTEHFDPQNLEFSVLKSFRTLKFFSRMENWSSFKKKIQDVGAIAEVWVEQIESSPSCQALINPKGEVELLSTHEQVLQGGMIYQGCRFPCDSKYRALLMEATRKIGQVLASKGCKERFGVDFVITRKNTHWVVNAIEINLRWGGTTHPFITAKYLTNSQLTEEGLLLGSDSNFKFYLATDNAQNEIYTGLSPEDFLEIVKLKPELQFNSQSLTGVVFHLLSAISVYGKFGFIAIGNSSTEAELLFHRTLETLQNEATLISSKKDYLELELNVPHP